MKRYQGNRPPAGVASDHFLMFTYKITPCPRKSAHDWIDCPYAHSGESARRREPHLYKPVPCPESKGGQPCPRGESCKYAHNDFEYWLHPSRFKTELCKQGPGCSRKVCFFAHQPEEIRKLSRSLVNDQCSPGMKKHTRRHNCHIHNEISAGSSPLPRFMSRSRPDWDRHQKMAELQLGEALQQLRLSQSPVNMAPMVTEPLHSGMAAVSSPLLPEGSICDSTLANLKAGLDVPHAHQMDGGAPPVHLHGEEGFYGLNSNSLRSTRPPALTIPQVKTSLCPGHGTHMEDVNLACRTSPVGPCTPDDIHGMHFGHLGSPSFPGRSSLEMGSPDAVHSLHDMNLTGALTSALKEKFYYPNPCDNVAAQMKIALQGSFRNPSTKNSLFPFLGQRESSLHAASPANWQFNSPQMAYDGSVIG